VKSGGSSTTAGSGGGCHYLAGLRRLVALADATGAAAVAEATGVSLGVVGATALALALTGGGGVDTGGGGGTVSTVHEALGSGACAAPGGSSHDGAIVWRITRMAVRIKPMTSVVTMTTVNALDGRGSLVIGAPGECSSLPAAVSPRQSTWPVALATFAT
jgi:hypothetical protein